MFVTTNFTFMRLRESKDFIILYYERSEHSNLLYYGMLFFYYHSY